MLKAEHMMLLVVITLGNKQHDSCRLENHRYLDTLRELRIIETVSGMNVGEKWKEQYDYRNERILKQMEIEKWMDDPPISSPKLANKLKEVSQWEYTDQPKY